MIEFYSRIRIGWNPGKDPFPGVMAVDTSNWHPRRDHNLSWEEYCKKHEVKERSTYLFNMSAEDCCKMVNVTDELLESFGEEYARTMWHCWDDENGPIIQIQVVDEDGNNVMLSKVIDARGIKVSRPLVDGEKYISRQCSVGSGKKWGERNACLIRKTYRFWPTIARTVQFCVIRRDSICCVSPLFEMKDRCF